MDQEPTPSWMSKNEEKIISINPYPLSKENFYECLDILVSTFNEYPHTSVDCLIINLYARIGEEDVLPFLGLILLHGFISYEEGVLTLTKV